MIAVADDVLPTDLYRRIAEQADLGGQDEAGALGLLPGKWERFIDAAVEATAGPVSVYGRHLVTLTNRSACGLHPDLGFWLAVLYLAKEWSTSWGGDLLFMDQNREITTGVTYKPNRMVIFNGNLHHVVRPPTASTDRRRVTLVSRYRKTDAIHDAG